MTTIPAPRTGGGNEVEADLACVILAHADPAHLHRLVRALDPFPVFLHCDRNSPADIFDAMVSGLPERCTVLPRMNTGWAKWENVAAELAGYRAALEQTDATHVALLTGADYPLAAPGHIKEYLAVHLGRSLARYRPLPVPEWGRSGGLDRLRYRHAAYRKRMLRLPVPRRLPDSVVPAGGAQVKILARAHAQAVVDVAETRPELVAFWRRSWVADETFVGSVLSTPSLVADFAERHVGADMWWIGWDGKRYKSPPWLDLTYVDALVAARAGLVDGHPKLFARKFSSAASFGVLDWIDTSLRDAPVSVT